MKLSDVCKQTPILSSVDSISHAISILLQAGTQFLPVSDENSKYCGVINSQSLLKANNEDGKINLIQGAINSNFPAFTSDLPLGDIPEGIQEFVVINSEGKVEGIVTSACLLQSLFDYLNDTKQFASHKKSNGSRFWKFDLIIGLLTEFDAIINSSYDGIFITDGKGNVLRLNEAYERITGISAKEVINKNMNDLVKAGVFDQSVTLLVLKKRQSVTINQVVKRSNKHVLVTGNPIFDKNGNIFRVVTNVRDVTELNNLEHKLSKTVKETMKYQAELSHLRSLQIRETDIIFRSRLMDAVIELAVKVADVNSNVLITGESGTGKELVAKLIHRQGKGDAKPFIKINCGAIPETLLESELFGYERGAFTGARKEGKPGMFELANNGTLFLDEIAEMPTLLQVKLLRAIQERSITRIGGIKPVQVNVRIISATHRNLPKMVQQGTFREDLYYRLMVVPIHIPSLRERKEDIPLLVMHFVEKFNNSFGLNKSISSQVVDKLLEYGWPGNVRELENVIERMMVTSSTEEELTEVALPRYIMERGISHGRVLPKSGSGLKEAVEATERHMIGEALKVTKCWEEIGKMLGVDRTTVFRKAVKYGLVKRK